MHRCPASAISDVREVMLSDKDGTVEMLRNGWEPLNICKRVKRLLWWKKVDYSVLYAKRSSKDRSSFGVTTGVPSGHPNSTE